MSKYIPRNQLNSSLPFNIFLLQVKRLLPPYLILLFFLYISIDNKRLQTLLLILTKFSMPINSLHYHEWSISTSIHLHILSKITNYCQPYKTLLIHHPSGVIGEVSCNPYKKDTCEKSVSFSPLSLSICRDYNSLYFLIQCLTLPLQLRLISNIINPLPRICNYHHQTFTLPHIFPKKSLSMLYPLIPLNKRRFPKFLSHQIPIPSSTVNNNLPQQVAEHPVVFQYK